MDGDAVRDVILFLALVALGGAFVGFMVGSGCEQTKQEQTAVAAGVATYEPGPEGGNPKFKYLKPAGRP